MSDGGGSPVYDYEYLDEEGELAAEEFYVDQFYPAGGLQVQIPGITIIQY